MAKIEYVGVYGEPRYRSDVKHLEKGVWELRHGVRRLSYWDTPGDGTYESKYPTKDVRTIPEEERNGVWWYPDMDSVLRLGCAWDKDGKYAPPEKVAEAIQVREEDAAHDRAS